MKAARRLTGASAKVTMVARLDSVDPRSAQAGRVILINNDSTASQPVPPYLDPLDPSSGAVLGNPRLADGRPPPDVPAAR